MKLFKTMKHRGQLWVRAADIPELQAAVRVPERPAEPDETVIAILKAQVIGDSEDLAAELRKASSMDINLAFHMYPLTRKKCARAAELLEKFASERKAQA